MASHQSLGGVERFHRLVQEMVRTHKKQLEESVGHEIKPTIGIGSWLVRHCCWLIFRFHVPRELGKSGYSSAMGHNYDGRVVCFGEAVMARKPQDVVQQRRTNKWENRWLRWLWIGKSDASDKH